MRIDYTSWSDFKADIVNKGFPINYQTLRYQDGTLRGYDVFALDRTIEWRITITEGDAADFDANYKANANKNIYSEDGKPFVRSEVRPIDCTTWFSTQGDDIVNGHVGGGKAIYWDFSNSDDITFQDSNIKRKVIECSFIDPVYLKSGTIITKNTLAGSYFDFYLVCSAGGYLPVGPGGSLVQMPVDVPIAHFVNHHIFLANPDFCSDLIDPGTISGSLPTFFKFHAEITVPISDIASTGAVTVIMYRERTLA